MRPIHLAQLDESRPVLVRTREAVRPHLTNVTVASITTTIRSLTTEVPVRPRNGLGHDAVVSCDNIQTIPSANLGRPLGFLRLDPNLGRRGSGTKYTGGMSGVQEYLVSSSGQMSLPAAARHRWALDGGGPVDVLDLGFGVLTVPRGEGRRLLGDLLSREEHASHVGSLAGDPDLATT